MTTHSDPTYVVDGVVHYCVGNMPGAVPNTSTYALTNVTLPYALGDRRPTVWRTRCARDAALARGVNAYGGELTNRRGRRGPRDDVDAAVRDRRRVELSPTGPMPARDALAKQIRTFLDHLTVERGLSVAHGGGVPARSRTVRRVPAHPGDHGRPPRRRAGGDRFVAAVSASTYGDGEAVPRDLGGSGAGRRPVPSTASCSAKARSRRDPTAAVIRPKLPRSLPKPLSVDEVARVAGAPPIGRPSGAPRPGDPRDAVRRGPADLRARRARRGRRRPGGGERPRARQGRQGAGRCRSAGTRARRSRRT